MPMFTLNVSKFEALGLLYFFYLLHLSANTHEEALTLFFATETAVLLFKSTITYSALQIHSNVPLVDFFHDFHWGKWDVFMSIFTNCSCSRNTILGEFIQKRNGSEEKGEQYWVSGGKNRISQPFKTHNLKSFWKTSHWFERNVPSGHLLNSTLRLNKKRYNTPYP